MATVLPSDVVRMIFEAFPWTKATNPPPNPYLHDGPALAALVDLLDRLPEATLRLTAKQYTEYVWAASALRHLAKQLEHPLDPLVAGSPWLWPTVEKQDAVTRLRLLLSECPDEGIEASTSGLEFLGDDDLRLSVRLDVSSSEAALNSGQWKAATVLAGSAVEALLLWTVTRTNTPERLSGLNAAQGKFKLASDPNEWDLDHYIRVARELGDISEQTADQARLAKDFRNLIHPGREVRKRMRCDRGTAHAAFAALNLVIADLERRCASGGK
ncbi:MAG: hypothetical protein IVW54_19060 [Candidatus Binataceae bacterium]|nr:hypothetical protein [Candidatus Binataceae bacterium]